MRDVLTRRGAPGAGTRPRGRALLTRLTGMRIVATAALGLLTLGTVFAATAGPREALATRTQALRQTLSAAPPLAQPIVASTTWTGLASSLAAASGGPVILTAAQLGEITGQLHGQFDQGVVHLAPASTDWTGMTTNLQPVPSGLPAVAPVPVRLELTYRQPLFQHVRLVAGQLPSAPAPPPPAGAPDVLLQVVVSTQTATRFGLHPGSRIGINAPQSASPGSPAGIILVVTGVVAPRDPSATFWTADPTLLTPDLETPSPEARPYWVGGVLADPGELGPLQQYFGPQGLTTQWQLPMAFGSLTGLQAQPLYDALNRLGAQAPTLTGDVAPAASALVVTPQILPTIGSFLAAAGAVDTLLWLLYVSLAVTGLVVLVLAARMVAMRRSAEFAMRRARGASVPQIALAAGRGTAVVAVPAAAVAVALAVLLVPGPVPGVAWLGPAAVLLVAVCAPAVVAGRQHRLPRRRAQGRRRRVRFRLVAEVTACLAAVAGILVFRQQGTQASAVTLNTGGGPVTVPGGGVNLYTSAAPVLIAIPAVIVVLRLYPLVVRGLLRGSVRRSGATAFLGLTRAARTALAPALPAFALVLALTVAAFAGMVRDAVTSGEVAASWQAAGADATIAATPANVNSTASISPAALRAAATVPGVTRAAGVWEATWATVPAGQQLTGLAVDPASYAALVAATRTFPAVDAGLLRQAPAGTPQPVLASPQAAAELGRGVVTLSTLADIEPIPVRVAGVLSGTPALPTGGPFVIMPLSALRSTATPPAPVPINELLLTGAGIDRARLAAVARDMVPGGVTIFRSDVLNGLVTAPLQHGTFLLFALALAAAAGLGLAVMLLGLALGAAEREAALARLAVMGLGDGQRARVVVLEVLPVVVAAAVAALACALVLPRVVAPAIDLSVFTGSAAGVALTPNVASIALPLAGLAVVAVVALAIEIRLERGRRAAASLQGGE
jgi:putative ABC transport system permease protein